MRKLLDAQVSRSGPVSREDLEKAVWGWTQKPESTNLHVLILTVKRRAPGIIVTCGGRNPLSPLRHPTTWALTNTISVVIAKKPLPQPKKGRPLPAPPAPGSLHDGLTVQVAGHGHQHFSGREAEFLRILFRAKLKYRCYNELQLALGLAPDHPRPGHTDHILASIRRRIPEMFETGLPGRGWRLNPQVRMFVVWDYQPVAKSAKNA